MLRGEITVQVTAGKKHTLYWADDTAILPNYTPIATQTAASAQLVVPMARKVAIPRGATRVAIFESTTQTAMDQAYAVIIIPTEKRFTTKADFTFASVSDIHVNYDSEEQNATGKWTAALNYFADLDLDYVILSGDMTSNGTVEEFEKYTKAINASRYDASRIYEAQGNHESQNRNNFLKYTSAGEDAGEIHPSKNSPYFHVLFKGKDGATDNLFIFMAQELSGTGNSSNQNNWSKKQLDWVENLLKTYSGTNTNIFIVQHTVFKGWGPGDTG